MVPVLSPRSSSPRAATAATSTMGSRLKVAGALLAIVACYHVLMSSMLGASFATVQDGDDNNVRYVYVSLGDAVVVDTPAPQATAPATKKTQVVEDAVEEDDDDDARDPERDAEARQQQTAAKADEYEELELDLSDDSDDVGREEFSASAQTPPPKNVARPLAESDDEEDDEDADSSLDADAEEDGLSAVPNADAGEVEMGDDDDDDDNEEEKEAETEDLLVGHILPDDILDDRSELLDEDDNSWSGFAVNDEILEASQSALPAAAADSGIVLDKIPVDLGLLKPADILCKDVSSKARCGEIHHCYWGTDTRSCRTELWAMECSMTKVKSTCAKLNKCTWASRSKTRGRYCVENLQREEEIEVADAVVNLIDPQTVPCYKLSVQDACDQLDRCYWNSETRACRTEPWAMTCNMTKVRSTCGKIPNCRWASKRSTKGRYCVPISDRTVSDPDDDFPLDDDEAAAGGETLPPNLMRVRIGNVTHTLTRCKLYDGQNMCEQNDHCYWKDNQCMTEVEFVACSSTKVRSTCEGLKHCIWPAKTLSKGKYCVDRYYLANPEELGTRCSLLRSKSKCEVQLACEWRSAKSTGRYCDRVVNLKKASRELHSIFPRYEDGLVPNPAKPVPAVLEDSPSRPNRFECPKNLECQDPTLLAPQLQVAPSFLTSSTGYKVTRCCDAHDEILKMMRAVTTHFVAVSFSDWWVDEGFALGMFRLNGVMPPWMKSHSISMVHKSPRAIKTILDKFNKGFFYRPYMIKGCELRSTKSKSKRKSSTVSASSDGAAAAVAEPGLGNEDENTEAEAGAEVDEASDDKSGVSSLSSSSSSSSRYSCKSISKISSKRTIAYYEVVNMNEPESSKLRIYPRVISRASRRCVSGPKGKPVPLDFVLPAKPCPHTLYGNDKVQCPHLPEAYLDLLYTSQWRTDPVPVSEAVRMPNPATDYEVDLDVNRTAADSTFASKLVWLNLRHCVEAA